MRTGLFLQKTGRSGRAGGERGMTLVELLAAMVIGSILITGMIKFLVDQSTNYIKTRQVAEMQQEIRWAMSFISDRIKLAGNGVPATCGWPVIENVNGEEAEPDSVSILASFKSLVITTTQKMGNEGSQVKVDNTDGLEVGDLCVISDGTFQEIFLATDVKDQHIWHFAAEPWNDDNKLDHRYAEDSSITVVTYYCFFTEIDDEGRQNLMVQTQAYEPQIILGDVEDFQVRFKMKNDEWVDDPFPEEIPDIRIVEISIRARSAQPIEGYENPVYGDGYQRVELTTQIIPKNITIL